MDGERIQSSCTHDLYRLLNHKVLPLQRLGFHRKRLHTRVRSKLATLFLARSFTVLHRRTQSHKLLLVVIVHIPPPSQMALRHSREQLKSLRPTQQILLLSISTSPRQDTPLPWKHQDIKMVQSFMDIPLLEQSTKRRLMVDTRVQRLWLMLVMLRVALSR